MRLIELRALAALVIACMRVSAGFEWLAEISERLAERIADRQRKIVDGQRP